MLLQVYVETFLKWIEINRQKSILLLGNFRMIEEQLNKLQVHNKLRTTRVWLCQLNL